MTTTITHQQAVGTLKEHGLQPDQPVAIWPQDGTWDRQATFHHHLGVKPTYKLADVKAWLGY